MLFQIILECSKFSEFTIMNKQDCPPTGNRQRRTTQAITCPGEGEAVGVPHPILAEGTLSYHPPVLDSGGTPSSLGREVPIQSWKGRGYLSSPRQGGYPIQSSMGGSEWLGRWGVRRVGVPIQSFMGGTPNSLRRGGRYPSTLRWGAPHPPG